MLLKGVDTINGDCNLYDTSLESLGDIKEIVGGLYLDTKSGLKDIGNLKKASNVFIKARTKKEAMEYAEKLGITSTFTPDKIIPILSCY